MWQLELANISIKGWIINSDQYCLFDGPGNILVLPAHYAEIVQRHLMTSDVVMVKDGGRCPHVLSDTFHQKSCLTLQCTLHHSPPFHFCTRRSLHSSVVCYPCPWGVPGGL